MARLQEILIGNIAVKLNLLTPAQLEMCLKEQEKSTPRKPLGLIMIEKGFITKEKLDELLQMQKEIIQRRSEEYQKSLQDNLFGRILIAKKFVSSEDVYDAVREQAELLQRGIRKRLGTILLEKGLLTESQINEVLEIQNKKVLYCERCDLIFTVEWVLGRAYACTKCGTRLLVPPKTIIVTERDSLLATTPTVTSSAPSAGKISLPKEELEKIYKQVGERVAKIKTEKIEKEGNYFTNFLRFLIFKPYTLIAFGILVGAVMFLNITLRKHEREANLIVSVKLPSETDTSFLMMPSVTSDMALEFDYHIVTSLKNLFSNSLETLCGISKKEGKFYNVKTQQLITYIEAQECENKIKSEMKNAFENLYYIMAEYEVISFAAGSGELRVQFLDFFSTEQDLADKYIRYANGEVNIGSKIYLYGARFGTDKGTKTNLYLSWCTYQTYKGAPVLKFALHNVKIREKEIMQKYGIRLYFNLLPYFLSEQVIYAKLARAELVEKERDVVKDIFLCKEE
ncbi:MAG: hypothetical protein ACK4NF_05630 [Planctomycetota bacterium]